jgi:hypothetical protein
MIGFDSSSKIISASSSVLRSLSVGFYKESLALTWNMESIKRPGWSFNEFQESITQLMMISLEGFLRFSTVSIKLMIL